MNKCPSNLRLFTLSVGMALVLTGCAMPTRQTAVPMELTEKAEVVGVPGVRYLVGPEMPEFTRDAMESFQRERAYLSKQGLNSQQPPADDAHRRQADQGAQMPPVNFLAISGGGDDGAYGAGLLCGWTASGKRPQFKGVTGISTGALIAPFAFLGPKYDFVLKKVYTEVSPNDILEHRYLVAAIFDDAMADNAPLKRLVKHYITADFLKEIAQEYQRGRLLFVATTNLDARQAVIWNMGKIAANGGPEALALFHDILLASAAIPGAFPPVMIDVEAAGQRYQEMHVDGGATAEVFLYPPALKIGELSKQEHVVRERNLYVIRNARLDPDWAEVERRTMSIAARAVSSLIHSQSIGDLYKIYAETQRDGINFNLGYIPKGFNAHHEEEFDTDYMRQLFQAGYDQAVNGYRWDKTPPGL